jgi:hypothetical protein
MKTLDDVVRVSELIARANTGRERAFAALTKMSRKRKAFAVLRDYVAAAAAVEEAELELQRIRKDIAR